MGFAHVREPLHKIMEKLVGDDETDVRLALSEQIGTLADVYIDKEGAAALADAAEGAGGAADAEGGAAAAGAAGEGGAAGVVNTADDGYQEVVGNLLALVSKLLTDSQSQVRTL